MAVRVSVVVERPVPPARAVPVEVIANRPPEDAAVVDRPCRDEVVRGEVECVLGSGTKIAGGVG
jgi:hypothetical protein